MSSSSKKKLRKEQESVKLTEKQLAAQKEVRTTRLYTTAFVVCMALILVVAVVVGVRQTITGNGIMEKKTVAMTVGSHSISNAELNYFYMDAINNFTSTYGSYAMMFGLDVTKPLNEQIYNAESGETWADYFLTSAQNNAQATYALSDAAAQAGYTLSEQSQQNLDLISTNLSGYAAMSGFSDAKSYLKAAYGTGATVESYREYCQRTMLAHEYQEYYTDSLSFTDADLRAVESENYDAFSSYSFNSYYLANTRFLTGGTTDENGSTVYSDEEKAAAAKAAEETAKALSDQKNNTVEALDAAIAALEINKDTEAASTANTNILNASISSVYASWVTDNTRKAGDITCIPNTTTASDGTETVNGYYVVLFLNKDENLTPMSNVRHILAAFEGGTTGENGQTVYSDAEKAQAREKAEAILNEWKSGAHTEESFAELANAKSDDGNGTTGGLYENINAGSGYVAPFKNWALDAHTPGDTDIVETEYGYHVMYFVGNTEMTYRDYMIESQLRNEASETWYDETVAASQVTPGNCKYIRTDLVLNRGSVG